MAILIDNDIDLAWSSNGDYIVKSGDILDTSKSPGQAFVQEVTTRIKSSIGDWKTQVKLGAGLSDFEGEINNQATAQLIESSIIRSLTFDDFLTTSDFTLDIFPITESSIVIRLNFLRILTNLGIDSKILLNFVYDLKGLGPFLLR